MINREGEQMDKENKEESEIEDGKLPSGKKGLRRRISVIANSSGGGGVSLTRDRKNTCSCGAQK